MTDGIHTDTGSYSHDWSYSNGEMSTQDIRIENAANPDPREYVGCTTDSGDDTIIGGATATANQTGFVGGSAASMLPATIGSNDPPNAEPARTRRPATNELVFDMREAA